LCAQKIGTPWLICRHGMSAAPMAIPLSTAPLPPSAFSHSKLQPRLSLVTPEEAINSCSEEAPEGSL
jgi:hypothetical protein